MDAFGFYLNLCGGNENILIKWKAANILGQCCSGRISSEITLLS